jgi:hypothetical protein
MAMHTRRANRANVRVRRVKQIWRTHKWGFLLDQSLYDFIHIFLGLRPEKSPK